MLRIKIILPKKQICIYRNLDMLRDALVNAWTSAGAKPEHVVGQKAKPWNFAPLGWRKKDKSGAHSLVVSTPDEGLTQCLKRFRAKDIFQERESTLELVDFSQGEIIQSHDPIAKGDNAISVVMLSPLAIRKPQKKGEKPKWTRKVKEIDLNSVVNKRLSELAQREVSLSIKADKSHIRANPKYDTLVQVKERPGRFRVFVIGMRLPLVLTGKEKDLRFAWHSGIGEKTRTGFGCLGLAEK